jgi:hypothetical protein
MQIGAQTPPEQVSPDVHGEVTQSVQPEACVTQFATPPSGAH